MLQHQMLVQSTCGIRSAWAVANTGHCWFRQGIDVFLSNDPTLSEEARLKHLIGYMWVEMPIRALMLSIAPNDQVSAVSFIALFSAGTGDISSLEQTDNTFRVHCVVCYQYSCSRSTEALGFIR